MSKGRVSIRKLDTTRNIGLVPNTSTGPLTLAFTLTARGTVLPAFAWVHNIRHSSSIRLMSKPNYQPTLEEIALAAEKRAKRARLAATTTPTAPKATVVDNVKGRILPRKWIELPTTEGSKESMRIKIMTWNVSPR